MSTATHAADCVVRDDGRCDNWCYGCERCEPLTDDAYLVCGECSHVYATETDLVDADQVPDGRRRSPDEIFACPICNHDF